ncbi:MAG: glycosyltransferase family 39 protein [Bacteroidota bacterium]|nr:glycosyltransferase family 39 protein [Bacteroidota bacterium]
MNSKVLRYNLLIAGAALLLFVPFLGAVHLFDWDEINFAECAREMLVTGDYFSVKINFQPFWEKPPLFIWMQALSMNIFGINEFAARLPNAIAGCLTLLVFFNIGRKLVDEKFGLIWALVYAGSFLPHFYFKSGIIDPWFNLFIFSGIYYFILFSNNNIQSQINSKSTKLLLFSALFIGLGVLTKGPVAVLVFGLCIGVYWIIKRFQPVISIKQIFIFAGTVAFVGGLWFLMLALTGNAAIIKEFFVYQVRLFNTRDAGHGGPFFYHWIVLLIGCFPLSIFALRAFNVVRGTENGERRKTSIFQLLTPNSQLSPPNSQFISDTPYQKHFKLWMMILFWVVLILFSIVKTKIVHYSSLCYFPLSFLAAYAVHKLMNAELVWKKYTGILLIVIASVIGIAISALPFLDKYKQQIISADIIKDKFAVENLKANVNWTGYEWLIGVALIVGVGGMLVLIKRNKVKEGVIGIFIISLLAVNMASLVVAPRIEKYSQGAAIEFYEYLQNKDCYIETLGFKSYAHLFYSHKKESANKNSYILDWLLTGEIDKPAYFVSKITSAEEVRKGYPDLKEIYRKNGFVFFVRKVK